MGVDDTERKRRRHDAGVAAVLARLKQARKSRSWLNQHIDKSAVSRFLNDPRRMSWPHPSTRAALEEALGWDPGELDRIGDEAVHIGSSADKSDLRTTEGDLYVRLSPSVHAAMSEMQRAEAEAVAIAAYYARLREMGIDVDEPGDKSGGG